MALNPESVGSTTEVYEHSYTWKDTVLYALGCGATPDELDYLFEKNGPKVLPTYAVVPSFPACMTLMNSVGGDYKGVVHGAQKITVHQPFASEGTLRTVGKVAGIYDLKRFASAVITSETHDESGTLIAETEWNIIFRFDGGFGGEPPPKRKRFPVPDRPADFTVEEVIPESQALLYRLSGDENPLHADPELATSVGFKAPILHGLCTYGYMGRALIREVCEGDGDRLVTLSGQFRKPVWPGETLVTEGWNEGEMTLVRAYTKERPGEFVVGNGYAEIK